MSLSRRHFIQLGCATLVSSIGISACQQSPKSKPNVLFIAVDDLNDWIGSLKGHPQAKTPNIDRLMNSGTNFTSAHCSAPVCAASRNSLLTGLKPTTTGWYTNAKFEETADKILADTPTLPEHFKNNGYNTLAGGKISHTGTSDYRHDKQWTKTLPYYEITNQYLLDRGYGYGSHGAKDHKYYPFPKDGGQIVQTFGPDTKGKSLCWGALDRSDIPHNGMMPDEYIANWAIEQLQDDHQQPFFLAAGFIRPHVPFTAPKEYFDMFPLDQIIMPDIVEGEMQDVPLFGKAMALGIIPQGDHQAVTNVSSTFYKELVRANLACIAFVDDQIGKVLNALDKSKYKDNTIVMLWSDHGQNFGEHRNWRKMSLWEESTHVPLAIKLPNQQQGQRCDQVVSLLDVYPTLTQLCGLPSEPSNEGLSLINLLNNPDFERKIPAITTWGYRNHSIRDEGWRYIQYRDGSEELYDHQQDPNEHLNLAADKKYQDKKLRLMRWIPKHNQLPSGMTELSDDFLDKRLQLWQSQNGIPDWLN